MKNEQKAYEDAADADQHNGKDFEDIQESYYSIKGMDIPDGDCTVRPWRDKLLMQIPLDPQSRTGYRIALQNLANLISDQVEVKELNCLRNGLEWVCGEIVEE